MRKATWSEDLDAYIEARRNSPFAWHGCDCVSFTAGAVEAMTGIRHALPAYATAADAARLMAERRVRIRMGDLFGAEIGPALARRGDLMLIEHNSYETLGVCVGTRIASPGPNGLVLAPRSIAVTAWRLG